MAADEIRYIVRENSVERVSDRTGRRHWRLSFRGDEIWIDPQPYVSRASVTLSAAELTFITRQWRVERRRRAWRRIGRALGLGRDRD